MRSRLYLLPLAFVTLLQLVSERLSAQNSLPSFTVVSSEEGAYLKQKNPNANIIEDNTPNNYLLILTMDTTGSADENFIPEFYKWDVKVGSSSGSGNYLTAVFDAGHTDNVPSHCYYSYNETIHVIKLYLPDASAQSSIYYQVSLSGKASQQSVVVSSSPKSGQLK